MLYCKVIIVSDMWVKYQSDINKYIFSFAATGDDDDDIYRMGKREIEGMMWLSFITVKELVSKHYFLLFNNFYKEGKLVTSLFWAIKAQSMQKTIGHCL